MQSVDGQGVATGPATANGHAYIHALSFAVYFGVSPAVEYNLGRTWKRLMGTIGVRDDASTKTDAQFTISLDGRVAKTGHLQLGAEMLVDLNVTDVLRLRFETKDMTPPACPLCGSGGGPFVWGDAVVTR